MEHSELFWSLFAVDMNTILGLQHPDTWDTFPLFQILNDYLRTDGEENYIDSFFVKSLALKGALSSENVRHLGFSLF